MLIRVHKSSDCKSSEITSKKVYLDRRNFLLAATVAGGVTLLPGIAPPANAAPTPRGAKLLNVKKSSYLTLEKITTFEAATSHNNFYEFGAGKGDPKENSGKFKPKPWVVEVAGHATKTGTFNLDDLIRPHSLEERIYRMRCVEAWSMVIPWVGFPLGPMLRRFEPTSRAKYVAFETIVRPSEMPGQRSRALNWPYVEGLRIDEAMNPLTLMTIGMYGEVLPNQNGAPLRLIVPWKYGFKGIKSINKIKFTEKEPPVTWKLQSPHEYGFYSNVNPEVDHPRWSQKRERRITGEGGFKALFAPKVDTMMFNGYAEEVAHLYQGMDLNKNF